MKKNLLLFLLIQNLFSLHPDPFSAIESKIPIIKSNRGLYDVLEKNSDSLVIVITYITHVFTESEANFYYMPRIYEDLFAKCKGNKSILFYRMHATKSCPQLLSQKLPAMNIFFGGQRISSLQGKKSKKELFDAIMQTTKMPTKENTRVIETMERIFGGDDGN